ncbi:MFS transporter [uncultured Sphingosinicella sp.]|mgnify:CR=1 FL=1|jgi:MFS family permease|uniref:MFS transporter n=1 Tax=uncultured Sphingosinicella sp. TaxID=478748 RepID=UPI0030D7C84D|tara:strand:- start:2239 stop:3906 length:1668 start_codon:yes stop_codon:yes gene_type:complete
MATESEALPAEAKGQSDKLVITASSLGTVFEWYDFYLYGLLATALSRHFFSGVNETTGFILALMAFAAGFAVRPFGALVFGRVGDVVGRKNTFLVTMAIMGLSTFAVGFLPGYDAIGIAAPIILMTLRLLQGLAIGGEYGGAAVYIAEHAPPGKRGFYTSFIQTTAMIGLILASTFVVGLRNFMDAETFNDWGWRLPFIFSIVLLGITLWIRLQLEESPVFQRMKKAGATSKAPLREAFGEWRNLRLVLIALFGAVAGQAVIGFAAHLYPLFYLEKIARVDGATANFLVATALLMIIPSFVFFGWLSDRIGRKPIMMTACVIAVFSYFPLYKALVTAANPAMAAAVESAPVQVVADADECSFQFDPIGRNSFDTTSCDIVKTYLARGGINYSNVNASPGTIATVRIGDEAFTAPNPALLKGEAKTAAVAAFQTDVQAALSRAGYPDSADPASVDKLKVIGILCIFGVLATMVYGPLAALLVELFPARIRYSSLSLPYHIGNGWIGGFMPTIGFAMVAATGNIYQGLWYAVVIAAITAVVGILFLPETYKRDIEAD